MGSGWRGGSSGGGRRGGGSRGYGGGSGRRYQSRNRDCDSSDDDRRSISSYGSSSGGESRRRSPVYDDRRRERSPYSDEEGGAPRHQRQPRYETSGRGGIPQKRDMPIGRGGYDREVVGRGGYDQRDRGSYRGGRGSYYDRGTGGYDRGGHYHYAASRHTPSTCVNPTKPEPIPTDLLEEHCIRIGVRAPKSPVTKDQVLQEVDRVGYGHKIVKVMLEEKDLSNPTLEWSRVYFNNEEEAEQCLAQLLFPGRMWHFGEWSSVVTQLLPVPGPYCGEIGGGALEAFPLDPADCVCIDAQGGEIILSTDHLYKTKGLIEYYHKQTDTKRALRRMVCKHFDPEKKIVCRFSTDCNFLHVKAAYMNKLIRTVPHQREIRMPGGGRTDTLQISSWEYDRRQDTLLVRDIGDLDLEGLKYLFAKCPGMSECIIRTTSSDVKPTRFGARGSMATAVSSIGTSSGMTKYGVVRFDSPATATMAIIQTFDSGLNISLWGVLEDVRLMQMREARNDPKYAAEQVRRNKRADNPNAEHHHSAQDRHSGDSHHYSPREDRRRDSRNNDDTRDDQRRQGQDDDSTRKKENDDSTKKKENDDNNDGETTPNHNNHHHSNSKEEEGDGDATNNDDDGESSEGVPFPDLPEGWMYGVSRKQDKYYFYQSNAKGKTTWKHPSTLEVYSR